MTKRARFSKTSIAEVVAAVRAIDPRSVLEFETAVGKIRILPESAAVKPAGSADDVEAWFGRDDR